VSVLVSPLGILGMLLLRGCLVLGVWRSASSTSLLQVFPKDGRDGRDIGE